MPPAGLSGARDTRPVCLLPFFDGPETAFPRPDSKPVLSHTVSLVASRKDITRALSMFTKQEHSVRADLNIIAGICFYSMHLLFQEFL